MSRYERCTFRRIRKSPPLATPAQRPSMGSCGTPSAGLSATRDDMPQPNEKPCLLQALERAAAQARSADAKLLKEPEKCRHRKPLARCSPAPSVCPDPPKIATNCSQLIQAGFIRSFNRSGSWPEQLTGQTGDMRQFHKRCSPGRHSIH